MEVTLEQRVKEKMEWLTHECSPFTLEKPYILIKTALTDIATEQKAIDINKACEWLKNDLADVMEENVFQKMLCRFRKTMEE